MARSTLILGGARSGKSARALVLAGNGPRVFIATAQPLDDEMRERIARHRAERGPQWVLVEEAHDIAGAIGTHAAPDCCLVIDCLTLWLSNVMHRNETDPDQAGQALIRALARAPGRVILVSNEVGLAIAPENALARRFRDAQGRLNQQIAQAAGRVELIVAGLPLVIKDAS